MAKKANAVRVMSKARIAETIASDCDVKKSVATKMLDSLTNVATAEVKSVGRFHVPGLASLQIKCWERDVQELVRPNWLMTLPLKN